MSSGLSMTSVNKIKELAEAKEYSLAVEILDSQNLEKSLNPQFYRTCGEVYENVGRMSDARNMYVKAHIMGPESARIVFSLINFYLKLGYWGLAEQYKDQYIAMMRGSEKEAATVSYIIDKAKGAEPEKLREDLEPWYSHDLDEEWSYELILLYFLLNKDGDPKKDTHLDMMVSDYRATFRKSEKSELLRELMDGKQSAEELFRVYTSVEHEDKAPEEDEIRRMEKEQLKKDYYRLHPGEVRDTESRILSDEEKAEEDQTDDDVYDPVAEAEILDQPDAESKFKSFLKRKFRKKTKADAEDEESETTEQDGGAKEAGDEEQAPENSENTEEQKETASSDEVKEETSEKESEEQAAASDTATASESVTISPSLL